MSTFINSFWIRLSIPWSVINSVFLQSFSVASKETSPRDIFFKPDGTKMYVIGTISDSIHEYDLSTAWDISTAVFLQSFSVAAKDTDPLAAFFKPDGLKMYMAGDISDSIHEYDLSTAWDISTAVFLQSFSVAAIQVFPTDTFFKPDGLKMYVSGDSGDKFDEYDLSTAWDISTSVFLQSFSVTTQDINPRNVFFKPDGLKMYMAGLNNNRVYEYDLSTAWDISTAVFLQSFSVAAKETRLSGLFFKPDGTKMYIVGFSSDSIHEYNL